jgi:hypothetical protein
MGSCSTGIWRITTVDGSKAVVLSHWLLIVREA